MYTNLLILRINVNKKNQSQQLTEKNNKTLVTKVHNRCKVCKLYKRFTNGGKAFDPITEE